MTSAVFAVFWIFISTNLVYGYDDFLYPSCVDTEADANRFSTELKFVFPNNKPLFISSDALNITSTRRKKFCVWLLNYNVPSLKISFDNFNLTDGIGCPTEYLAFKFNGDIRKDLKFCGSSYPKVLYLDPIYIKILYTFNPDLLGTENGFKLRIEESRSLCESEQQLNVGNIPLYIASPGYPISEDDYGSDIDCRWDFNATDQEEVILLEFLLFDPRIVKNAPTRNEKSTCYIDGLEVQGSKTYIKLCDGEYDKVILETTNSTVSINFRKLAYNVRRNVFIIKYYTVPKYDYGCTGRTDSKTLTAYRGRSQVVNVIRTSGKICSWNVEAENSSDVIIYELLSYKTKAYYCYSRLRITEVNGQVNDPLGVYTCIEKSVKYYRSSTSKIIIDMVDKSQSFENYGGVSFSFYSIPQDVLADSVTVITTIPSYIWIPSSLSQTRKDVIQSAILKSHFSEKSVHIKGLMANLSEVENLHDYIDVFDGYYDYMKKINAACGMKSNSVTGSSTSILIKTRPNNINAGIWIKAEATDKSVLNSNLKDLTVGNIPKVITSPGYPQPFYCFESLYWQIRTESIDKVVSLSTDPVITTTKSDCTNQLLIYDGSDSRGDIISRWCLGTKESYVSSGSAMYLTLRSYSSIEPFKLLLSERKVVECSNGNKIATTFPQYITSPFYPGHYPNLMDCKWYIRSDEKTRIEISINYLLLSNIPYGCTDYLRISDGLPQNNKICYNKTAHPMSFVTKYNWATVEFYSDGSNTARGFNISYQKFDGGGDCNQDFIVGIFPRYLNSTNYPRMYERGFECVYRLNKALIADNDYNIVVSVVACDLPPRRNQQCTSDYVNIYDGPVKNSQDKVGTFCGNENTFTVTAKSMSVLIDFVTAETSSGYYYKGFRIKYVLEKITGKTTTCSVGRPFELVALSTPQYFTSPNYPNNYENDQYCQWRITSNFKTIRFEVIDSDLGPKPVYDNEDYVKVYDGNDRYSDLLGKLTDTYTPTYLSSGPNLYIEFNSNAFGVYKGFKVKYYTTSDNFPEESSSSKPQYGVIGGVFSGIALLFVFICACLCRFCMKRKTPPRRQSQANSQRVVFNTSNNTIFVVPPGYDANNTSSPPPYSGVSNPEYDIAAPYHPGNIPTAPPPPYSELPTYEDAAKYEIPDTRSHPDPNRAPGPQRQISRDDLRIISNPQQFQVRRRNNSTQSIDSQEDLALVDERGVTSIDNQTNHPNYSIPL